jgi:anti-anti-sigma regulatory factor
MLKIGRSSNGQVVFRIIGRMQAEGVADLEELLKSEHGARQIVLDLKDLTLVDRDAVRFFERCEMRGIKLENCPAYIREWITRERGGR